MANADPNLAAIDAGLTGIEKIRAALIKVAQTHGDPAIRAEAEQHLRNLQHFDPRQGSKMMRPGEENPLALTGQNDRPQREDLIGGGIQTRTSTAPTADELARLPNTLAKPSKFQQDVANDPLANPHKRRELLRGIDNAVTLGAGQAAVRGLGNALRRPVGGRMASPFEDVTDTVREDASQAPGYQAIGELAGSLGPGAARGLSRGATAVGGALAERALIGGGEAAARAAGGAAREGLIERLLRGGLAGGGTAGVYEGGKALASDQPVDLSRIPIAMLLGGGLGAGFEAAGAAAGGIRNWVRDHRSKTGQMALTIEGAGGRIGPSGVSEAERLGPAGGPGDQGLISRAEGLQENEQGIQQAAAAGGRRMVTESQQALWDARRQFGRQLEDALQSHDAGGPQFSTAQVIADIDAAIADMSSTSRTLTPEGEVLATKSKAMDPAAKQLKGLRDSLMDRVAQVTPLGVTERLVPGARTLRETVALRQRLDAMGREGTIAGKDTVKIRQLDDKLRQHIGDPNMGGSPEVADLMTGMHKTLSEHERFNDQLLGSKGADIGAVGGYGMARGEMPVELGDTLPAEGGIFAQAGREPPVPTQTHLARAEQRLAGQGKWGAAGGATRQQALDELVAAHPQYAEDVALPKVARAISDLEFNSPTVRWRSGISAPAASIAEKLELSPATKLRLIDPMAAMVQHLTDNPGAAGLPGFAGLRGVLLDQALRKPTNPNEDAALKARRVLLGGGLGP